jgi:hypothetical protein
MVQGHVRDEGVLLIEELLFPFVTEPGKPIPGSHTEAAEVAAYMILLPHMREIEVPNEIILVKTNQKATVPYRDVTRHGSTPFALSIAGWRPQRSEKTETS